MNMSANAFQQLQDLLQEIEVANPASAETIEQFRLRYLGSNNVIKPLMGEIRNVPNEQKKEFSTWTGGRTASLTSIPSDLPCWSFPSTLLRKALPGDVPQTGSP